MSIGKILNIIGISIITIIVIVVLRVMGPFVWQLITLECDNTDYSPIIKKVAIPMQKELEIFYKQNKIFPNTQERNKMLEKVGCKVEGNDCIYERENNY